MIAAVTNLRTAADPGERAAWVALASTPGIGWPRLGALLAATGSARGALEAPFAFLCSIPGISRACASLLTAVTIDTGYAILAATAKLGGAALIPGDEAWPAALADIPDPPAVLFALGRVELVRRPAVAIVGSRSHSAYGGEVTELLAEASAKAGIVVVSGMARGLDAVAHGAALDAGGASIGVLGNGLGIIYPAANRRLYERMVDTGLLLTEFPPGERPQAWTFPRRNRLISGLARATVVVEAAVGSGALITADQALEQGRDVLAVPGPITSPVSEGTNRLIRDGATPLLEVRDLLELFGIRTPSVPADKQGEFHLVPPVELPPDLGDQARAALEVLALGPRLVDDVAVALEVPAATALQELSMLELLGLVVREAGGWYRRAPGSPP
ncbi:MAG: DNA-processing protein DprA [Gemmatimonadota bacterium]